MAFLAPLLPYVPAIVSGGMAIGSAIQGNGQQNQLNNVNNEQMGWAQYQRRQQEGFANQLNLGAGDWRSQTNRQARASAGQLDTVNRRDMNYFMQPNRDFSSARSSIAGAKAPKQLSLMNIGARTVNLNTNLRLNTNLNLGRVNLKTNYNFGRFQAPDLNKYNFDPTKKTLQTTYDETAQMGNRARATSLEQFGQQNAGANAALNAQLMARGLSGGGAAAGALAQAARDQAQQRVELERGLADQAGSAIIQAGQFDAANQLQLAGLESEYNLGFNNLNQQRALNQFTSNRDTRAMEAQQNSSNKLNMFQANANAKATEFSLENEALLGQETFNNTAKATQFSLNEESRFNAFNSNLAARDQWFNQGMARANFGLDRANAYSMLGQAEDNRVMQRNTIGRQLATDSYGLMNSHYQNNFLAPQLSLIGGMNPYQGYGNASASYAGGAQAGGAGFGSALASALSLWPQGK